MSINIDELARQEGLVWVTEAMVVYKHTRGWFQRRIDDGRLKTKLLPGTNKIFVYRDQVEAEEKASRDND